MQVFNLSSNEEIEIHHGSPKFAVQWCESVRQSRSLEFAAMSQEERDKEFPVTEGSISISCGGYCTQIEEWRYAKKQWESAERLAYEAKKAYEAALIAEIKRKYPRVELSFDSIRYENKEFALWKMDADEESALENNFPEIYALLQLRAN